MVVNYDGVSVRHSFIGSMLLVITLLGSQLTQGEHTGRSGRGVPVIDAGPAKVIAFPARGDFRLASGSPAIGKGVPLNATGFETDFRGIPRRRGSTWDIGAYEFVPGSLPN